ncbi:uncharacterized protein M6B38_356940 [Iris pallida]|uniref:Uncharacterized protein n=1 Tax=Iris pallida TaxID=29817 RepID=A0AAX6GMX8_IRIPA|nr:uncharacterized protein M6B38_356940 [Iris pallida]
MAEEAGNSTAEGFSTGVLRVPSSVGPRHSDHGANWFGGWRRHREGVMRQRHGRKGERRRGASPSVWPEGARAWRRAPAVLPRLLTTRRGWSRSKAGIRWWLRLRTRGQRQILTAGRSSRRAWLVALLHSDGIVEWQIHGRPVGRARLRRHGPGMPAVVGGQVYIGPSVPVRKAKPPGTRGKGRRHSRGSGWRVAPAAG